MIEQEQDSSLIKKLIDEFTENRNELKLMITDINIIKSKIDSLFPESLDKRFVRFFEEKVKSATAMFSLLLDLRKEISRSLKDEVELRRKIDKEEDGSYIEDLINISHLAKKVEALKKKKETTMAIVK